MSERDAIADEIERAMKGLSLLSGDDLRKATHAFGKLTYAHSSKIIDALRARDREDGAREMRERAAIVTETWPWGRIPTAQQAEGGKAAAGWIRALPLSARTEAGDA